MGNVLIAVIFAAGAAAFIYSKFGRRIGYDNSQNLWTLIAISFIMTFIMVFIVLKLLIS